MATITFAQINQRITEHRRAEEARNAPAARACRALETLRDALDQMSPMERYDVMNEVCELIDEWHEQAIAAFTNNARTRSRP